VRWADHLSVGILQTVVCLSVISCNNNTVLVQLSR